MLGGVPHQGGLPGQPGGVSGFGGVSFLHVRSAEWGNQPYQGNQIPQAWRDDFTSKTAKTLMKLTVPVTI